MEQNRFRDDNRWWRLLVVIVVTAGLLLWLMNTGDDPDDRPTDEIAPAPGATSIEEGEQVEELDNGPLHRPPGTAPADPRRPTTAPYDDFDPDERRNDAPPSTPTDESNGEVDGDDTGGEDHDDERSRLRPAPTERRSDADESGPSTTDLPSTHDAFDGDDDATEVASDDVDERKTVDIPPSDAAFEGYREHLDEAHERAFDDPALYSTIAAQGLADALYMMSAGRTLSTPEAARQRDHLVDRTRSVDRDRTSSSDDHSDIDDDASDDDDDWTVWLEAADWLRQIQQHEYPELADKVDDVEEAADQLDPTIPEHEQTDELAEFFELVELVLEAMAIEDDEWWEMGS